MKSKAGKKTVESLKIAEYGIVTALLLSLVCAGGYFVSGSFVISIVLLAGLLILNWKDHGIYTSTDISVGIIFVIVLLYFASALWGIDSGMAIMGGVKFLPWIFFVMLICYPGVDQTKIIEYLPVMGSVITILSIVMMQFDIFKPYVTVAGRLAGSFQYPNTYALSMLICFIIAIFKIDKDKADWLWVGYAGISIIGILLSGSRMVFVLTIIGIIAMAFAKKEARKLLVISGGIIGVVIVASFVLGVGKESITHLMELSFNSSTLLGRLLYWKDAVPYIIKHPLGLGYYGYYYTQQEFQTGVYSVLNVHNELLQLMLDIGVIPAVLFYGMLIKQLFKKDSSYRNRLILLSILLHSLFDYDFQFLFMFFVLMLFIDFKPAKKIETSVIGRTVLTVVSCGMLVFNGIIAVSDFMYTQGNYKAAIKLYQKNTAARITALTETEDVDEMKELAESIVNDDEHISLAYSALARGAYADGDVELFIKYKLKAISLAPYQFEEYLDYLNSLYIVYQKYIEAGDKKSAELCLNRMEDVPNMLKELERKTSSISWEINDRPQVTLPYEYTVLFEQMRGQLDE